MLLWFDVDTMDSFDVQLSFDLELDKKKSPILFIYMEQISHIIVYEN